MPVRLNDKLRLLALNGMAQWMVLQWWREAATYQAATTYVIANINHLLQSHRVSVCFDDTISYKDREGIRADTSLTQVVVKLPTRAN